MTEVRKYNPDSWDIVGITRLLTKLSLSEEKSRFDKVLQDPYYYISNYLSKKSYDTLIARIGDEIIGFMIGEHWTNEIYNVVMLYVDPDHRRKKVAYTLKATLTGLARDRKYKKIISQVRTNNVESINLNAKSKWKSEPDKLFPDYYIWFTKEIE